MPKPLPDHIADLAPYVPGLPIEVVERRYGIRNAVKLASNENPLGPSPKAVAAMSAALAGVNYYPEGSGWHLRHALAEKEGVTPEEIVLGNGSNEIIDLLADTFVGKRWKAVVSQGAFLMYKLAVKAAGGRLVETPMRDFTHDLAAMAEACDAETALVYLANPNNPTGTYNRRDELEQFLATIPADTLIALDEAYIDYIDAPDYPRGIGYYARHPNLILLRTFSKIYGLAGVRLGYGVMRPELARDLNRVRPPFNVSSPAQAAGLAALGDRDFTRRAAELNRAELPRVCGELERSGIPFIPSLGNFVMVEVGDGPAFSEQMIARGVIIRPIANYGFKAHVRVSIGKPEENDAFLAAARAALGK